MKYLKISILALLLAVPLCNYSQEKKPKVVVVLSGGGAKGLAHIPLLQALDSLGIVPDLVIGTSMGSIVGGLYAAGYSGDSIAAISKSADWDYLLGGDVSLKDVGVESKSEFKKYLIDLDLKNGKPKVGSALLKDQNLREFIYSLTYPTYKITDFDKLPIPFRAMTTDIVNGKEVLLGSGSLGYSMRASMSIPGIFQPVPYQNTLLVDGGVLNNFPVDVAIEMGADIIIGSDVGGGMQQKDKLDNIASLLFQAGMLTSNLKNPKSRDSCDILLDHIPNLTYSTGDFKKGNIIIEEGRIATKENLNKLVEVAERIKGFDQRKHELPLVDEKFELDTIIYSGVSDANLKLVKARLNIWPKKTYAQEDVVEGVNRAMGTNIFSQITTNYHAKGDKIYLELNGTQNSRHQLKGALHYETYRGVGLILNYTGRNIMGESSRFLVTADIAEQPRGRIQYQKNFGTKKSWWWRSDALGELLKQKVFIDGEVAEDMKYRFFQFDNQFNKNINSFNSFVGLGFTYDYTNIIPQINPDINNNILNLRKYYYNNLELNAHYVFNNLNKVFYPTTGTYLKVAASRAIVHKAHVEYVEFDVPTIDGKTNGYTKFNLDIEKRIDFQKKLTGIIRGTGAFIIDDQLHPSEVSFRQFGYAAKYFLGGNLLSPKKNSYTFQGLHEDELAAQQFMRLGLALQVTPFDKFYVTPHFDIASVGFGDFNNYWENAFSPPGNWQDTLLTSTIMSAGATLSYHSLLGPVNFDLSWVNNINKVRVFFSIGLVLNR